MYVISTSPPTPRSTTRASPEPRESGARVHSDGDEGVAADQLPLRGRAKGMALGGAMVESREGDSSCKNKSSINFYTYFHICLIKYCRLLLIISVYYTL